MNIANPARHGKAQSIVAVAALLLSTLVPTHATAQPCGLVFALGCPSCGDETGRAAVRYGIDCLMCENSWCIAYFTDPNGDKSARDLALSLGGEPYASAEGGVVTYFEDPALRSTTRTEDPIAESASGIVADESLLLDIAETDPIAAFVLSLFLPVNYDGNLSLLAGRGTTSALLTPRDIQDAIKGDFNALENRARPSLPHGTAMSYEWTSDNVDDDTIVISFSRTAENDPGGLIPESLTSVRTRVWISKSARKIVAFDHE